MIFNQAIPRRFCDENLPKKSQYILLRRYMEEKHGQPGITIMGSANGQSFMLDGENLWKKTSSSKEIFACLKFELDKSAKELAFIVHVSPTLEKYV